jgi:sugar phosphate isomerase/epimerase
MVCNQSHAPFPIKVMTDDVLKRAIECTAIVGGEICVIHPNNDKSAEENAETYLRLLPFAKEYGVKIATENMWNWYKDEPTSSPAACSLAEDFVRHIDAVADPYFVACLDIGHAEMRGSGDGAVRAIRSLGKRLAALHVHDNDKLHDSHLMPFTANIDFEPIAKALADVGYTGYVTLEADRHLEQYGEERILDGIIALEKSARRFAAMIK